VQDAEWEDRTGQASVLDEAGYLYVIGGEATGETRAYQNDVWKSTISFHDLSAVSSTCNVVIPTCGAGLRCWPDSGTMKAADGSFVSCSACPHPSTNTTSSSTALTVALIFFVVFSVIAVTLAVYSIYTTVKAGYPSPVPLPQAVRSCCLPSVAKDRSDLAAPFGSFDTI
jgi:hypothetical protein